MPSRLKARARALLFVHSRIPAFAPLSLRAFAPCPVVMPSGDGGRGGIRGKAGTGRAWAGCVLHFSAAFCNFESHFFWPVRAQFMHFFVVFVLLRTFGPAGPKVTLKF